ncbi:MAG: S-layer homology domain-containing protein [Clostridia bacterium]|nr:S-layer homology domain-containing protein [Clostridia bacterium]
MKKTLNRVVSFLLTLTMVFGLCCFPVSAVATDVNMSFVFTDTDFEVLTGPAKVGDIVFVGIKIDPYEPIKGFGWMFNYDPEVLAFDEEYKNKKQGFAEGYYSAAGYNVVNAETAGTIIVTGAGSKGNAVPAEDIADMENGCFIYFKFDVIGSGDAACEFNTAGQGNFEWSMIGEDEQTVSVVLPEEPTSLVCIKSGVSLSAATAVADSKNDITLTATAINADGENVTKNVSWSVSPAGVGVTVANDGTVTVGAKAAAGTYAVTATGSANAFGEAVATASAELQVTRNASAATQVVVTPATAEVARPYYNAQDNTASLTATVYDQYGAEMSVGVSWSGDLAVYNGKVTVTDATKAGIYTVTASRSGAFGSAVITVTEESAIAASLTLDKTADTVTVPAAGAAAATVSYTATVKDQYNRDMDTVIEWTLSGAPEGVTVDANGKVSVPAGIGNCSFTLQAKAGDCTATVAIKAVDLTFVNNGAVTVKADPTYGDTWAEIVTIDADKFTAKLGDATLSGGEYTLSVSGTPAVGTYTFDVLYSDSTYTDVVAYSGEVTVAAKTLTVVSDGVSMTKVYDATTDAGALSGDVTFTGKVGEDDVTLKVEKGTYADKNVGNKTVTLTLSLAGAKKDQYALSVNSVEIPASITVSDEVTATVSAAQNSVFGVGSFTAPAFSGIGGETVDGTLTYTYGGKDKTKDAIEAELQTLVKGDTAEIGYKFVASGNYEKTLTGTITVTMVDILFKVGDAEAMVENAVTVKADATYGDTWADIVTVSNQIKASVNGVAVDGTYSLSVSGTPDAGTQSYAVLFSASSGDKYQGVTVLESTVTVAPKSVAVTWSNTALTYNGAEQKPTATTEVADLAITVSGAQTDANIGNTKYTATASTANTNYALTNDSTEYTIAPMRVAVTWNNTALTYNGAEQKPTATTEVADLAITVSGAQTDASAEPYTAIALARNSNYTLTNAKTEYTIAPKSVAVTWSNTALTYNGTAQAPTAAAEGVNGALTLTVDGKTTDAGTGYTATASTADTNYSLTNAACTFDIAAKSITVTIDAIAEQTFTGEAIEPTVTLRTDDLAEGDTLAKDADYTVSCTDNVNAGTASVTVKSTDGGNYTFADAFASFTIVPAAAPSLAVQGTTSFKYSVSGAQSVTISGVPANAGAVTYTVGTVTDAQDVLADTVTAADGVVTFTLSSMPAFVEGVTATIPVTVAMANYATAEVTITIIITDRDVPTVTAENITVTYTGTALTADSIRGTSSVAGTWSWVTDPATMVNAGSYTATVTFTPVDLVNYTDVDTTVVVTVDPAKVAVPAAAADLVYSGTEQVGVAGGALYTVEGGSATNAGSYTATVTLSDSANYAWATAFDGEITWTIAKAPSAGTPSYTKVKNSGKTLADAALAIGDITPVGGTIRWVDSEGNELPADTEIKANTAYTWLYTPADTNNYAELSDSVVLYKRNSSITLPFVGALGSGGTETYAVAVDQTIRNGVVTVSTAKASQGVTVTVTVTPNAGYTVQSVTVTTVSNKLIAVQKNADGSYSFAMPAVKVVVSAAFSDGKQNVFADVYTSDWYHASVYSAYGKGLMKGVSDTLFAPKSNFTRGMMMTALARLAGENTDGGTPWYAKGMAWATQQGISDGTNPESDITREQAVTMLYRYMGSPKVSENGLDSFTDSTATGDWAVDAMNWAISVGLLQGDAEGTIRPGDTATRAEIAALMVRFVDNVQ